MNRNPDPRIFSLPPIFSTVRNGMKIYVVPRSELPLVSIHLVLPDGAEADPPGKAGLADLTAEMLTLGTRERSGAQLAAEVDSLGASLSAHAGWDATSIHIQGLKEDLDRLLDLLREAVLEPAFSEEEFSQLQQRRLAMLAQQRDESQIVATERFEEILFRETPYDHPVYGNLKSLPLISLEETRNFYRQGFLPAGSFWVFVGDLDPEACFRHVEAEIPGAYPQRHPISPFNPQGISGIKTFLIDRPELTQSQIRLGHLGMPHAHPDYIPSEVMNYILGGGGFSSRLMQKVRVELGLTYGIRSSLEPRRNLGSFTIATFTPTETTSRCVQEILSVMKSFRGQGASKEEENDAIRFLRGSYPMKFETLGQFAQRIIQAEVHGIGVEFLRDYPERITAVGGKDILRCAREHIDSENMVITIVGRAQSFGSDFGEYGTVEFRE
jgi:zinc protease